MARTREAVLELCIEDDAPVHVEGEPIAFIDDTPVAWLSRKYALVTLVVALNGGPHG